VRVLADAQVIAELPAPGDTRQPRDGATGRWAAIATPPG
jgi:hypothetical protein